MKSCCIPAWPRSSRGLSCSRRRPGSAKAVFKFRVGARRRRWLAPAARTCRIDPYILRCEASKCPDEVATAVRLHVNYALDYITNACYNIRILAHEGRLRRRS
jgi:hypothetical protein